MKSFRQYIYLNETVSEFTDNIVNTLIDAGKELNFDPRNLKQHRQFGTHHDLLKGNDDRSDIQFDDIHEHAPSWERPRTNYRFKIKNLGNHDPEVSVQISHILEGNVIDHGRSRDRDVSFTFGKMYGNHPTLDAMGKMRAAPHVYDGVMRAVTHYLIHNNIDPSKIKFGYDAHGNEEPTVTSSGKARRVTPIMQKARVYSHIESALRDLHSRITGKS